MSGKHRELLEAFEKLLAIKGECTANVCGLYSVADMTVKQISYLKIIDSNDKMTITELAEKTGITKPSVTNLIGRLTDFECVYKEKCSADGRVSYVRLTEKGINIARHEHIATVNLIQRIMRSLNEKDVDDLIRILNKVG